MITIESTPFAAGAYLWGDYRDLTSLHETIHDIAKMSPYGAESRITEYCLSLAYDIRKAYENMREEKTFGIDAVDQVTYRGEYVLWPMLIVQVNLLRQCAAYGPTTKRHQSHLYLLESGIEEALINTNAAVAQNCLTWLETPLLMDENYYLLYIEEITRQYVLGPQGQSRIKKLPALLASLHPLSDEYQIFASNLEATAKEHQCSPHELTDNSPFPEFKA